MDILRISKSKLREELLNLYFANSGKEFFLRELERILGHSVGNIRRELIKLEKEGIFNSHKKGNLAYYSLNVDYPLYDELKSVVSKTSGIKWALKSALDKITGITASFIYGSFARGEQTAKSDIDIFIIGDLDESVLADKFGRLEKKFQRDINYSLYDAADFNKKKYEKNSFILEVMKQPKIFLTGGDNEL